MSARKGICVLLAFVAIFTSSCMGAKQQNVYDELMDDRRANELKVLPVQMDAQLKAQAWAEKLAKENKLYHSTLSDGIKANWCSLGENVGYGPSVAAVQDAYMESDKHRDNILNPKWNGVGVGHATNGLRIFTVQVFIKTC